MLSSWPITSQADILIKRHWAEVRYLDQQTHLYRGGVSLRSSLMASLTHSPDCTEQWSWGPATGSTINQHIFQVHNSTFESLERVNGMNRKSVRLLHWILQFFARKVHGRKLSWEGLSDTGWSGISLLTMTVPGKHKNPLFIASLLRKERLQAIYVKETTWKWQLCNSSEKTNKWSHDCSKWK